MIYLDTAYLAKFYLDEPESDAVRHLAETHGEVACCILGQLETVSVFHRKYREKALEKDGLGHLCQQFDMDSQAGLWTWLPISPALISEASTRLRNLKRTLFLRSSDALHLTAAMERGLKEIYTNDSHMIAAAPAFGLKPLRVSDKQK